MKKSKIIGLTALIACLLPEIVSATEYVICGNNNRFPSAVVNLISTFLIIIKIAVPILLVISGMISFFKVTFSSNVEEDLKKAKSKLITNIIAAVVIFFTISIVNFAVSLVSGKNSNVMDCVNCFINPENCEQITCTVDSEFNETCSGIEEK